MKTIVVTGAFGQIGSELIPYLRSEYGETAVIATDLQPERASEELLASGPYDRLDITNHDSINEIIEKYKPDTIINLAALLSAVAEAKPQLAFEINVNGLTNLLEACREKGISLFTPSSIGAFGPSTPKQMTPQTTIMRPTSMYGITKVTGELLCNYYHEKFGVDTRGVRFPGIISNVTPPGGGTTDYAVDIYYEAIRSGHYTCFLKEGSKLDMMYMPDALRAVKELLEADGSKLRTRNAYNIASMSFAPEDVLHAIQKEMPDFTMDYNVDPLRQSIADSWPERLDDHCAREDWGWKSEYDLTSMTKDMLSKLKERL